MTFAEFCRLEAADKLVLVELRLPLEVQGKTWTDEGSGAYSCTVLDGEIVACDEDGAGLTKVASLAACQAAASSFFYDYDAQLLYVHLAAGDDPSSKTGGVYDHVVLAYWWRCSCDRQFKGSRAVCYTPTDATHEVTYTPDLHASSVGDITQAVGEYHVGEMAIQFGTLGFVTSGWHYRAKKLYVWHNVEVRVKVGQVGSLYADLATIFIGVGREPTINDAETRLEVTDPRVSQLRDLPANRYTTAAYPNLHSSLVDKPIPVLLGEVEDIAPHLVDTVAFTFKYNDGDAYGDCEALVQVRRDGSVLTPVTDYTSDLAKGEFTLLADPGNAEIRCDAKGIKCDLATPGTYSYKSADLLHWALTGPNAVPAAKIDTAAFVALKAIRTQKCGWWLVASTATLEFVRLLQRSTLFHLIPTLDGTYTVRYYSPGIDSGTIELTDSELADFEQTENTAGAKRRVVVSYAFKPGTQQWLLAVAENAKTGYKYHQYETLPIDTCLVNEAEAQAVSAFYLAMYQRPPQYLAASTELLCLDSIPTDKVVVTHQVTDPDEGLLTVCDAEVYRILKLTKNASEGKVGIHAISDLQAAGQFHADVAYQDYYSDSLYGDVLHLDQAAYDDAHDDVAHQDQTYTDYQYDDVPHSDHQDEQYSDNGYADIEHTDEHHQDAPHEDAEHQDDSHTDDPHQDDPYGDWGHSDSPHVDQSHVDAYTDIDHQDTEI